MNPNTRLEFQITNTEPAARVVYSGSYPITSDDYEYFETDIIFNITNVESVTSSTFYFTSTEVDAHARYALVKLEKGNKATDWTPAPEDVEANIETAKTEAENAAKSYADAQAEAAEVNAKAHADGIVTAEEQARIDDVNAKLAAAKAYAEAQDALLKTQQEAYADGEISKAEQAAIDAAEAYADLKKQEAEAYADGIVSDEEARAIADAQAKYEAAKAHAEQLVEDIEIGGRNLISSLPNNWQQGSFGGSAPLPIVSSYKSRILITDIKVSPNTQYTFSMNEGYEIWVPELNEDKLGIVRFRAVFWSNKTFTTTSNTEYLYVSVRKTGTAYDSTNPEDFISPSDIPNVKLKLEKGNKATDWTPAPEDVQAEINTAKQEALTAAGNAQTTANSLKDFTDTAFRDGIIDRSESVAIEKYKNSLNEAMAKAEASYNKVYTNTYLEGTAKTSLLIAKINLWGQRDTLLSAINTAISGGTTTPAQKTSVDNAFSTFNNLMTAFQNALEEANKAIQTKLDAISKGYVDDLEIGGRNLIAGTSMTIPTTNTYPTSGYVDTASGYTIDIPKGNTYIMSFEAKSTISGDSIDNYFYSPNTTINAVTSQGRTFTALDGANRIILTDDWERYWVIYTQDGSATNSIKRWIVGRLINSKGQGGVSIRAIKLESGNKATDWTPAPEDVDEKISDVDAKAAEAQAKANKSAAVTDLFSGFNGGLATAVIMEMREPSTTTRGDATGFISGMRGDGDLPFLGAGRATSNGVYADAIAGTAKAIIRHDGSVRFTDGEFTGTVYATDGEFTGKITASTGDIGPFGISAGQLEATSGYDSMLLSANLIRFTGQYSSVYIGADTFPASNGGAILGTHRISVNRTISGTVYGNVGLYINITGSKSYDDAGLEYTGNHALYIPKGSISGVRFGTKRVNGTSYLSVLDTNVIVVANNTTVWLPNNPEDGQMYWINPNGYSGVTVRSYQNMWDNGGSEGTSISIQSRVWQIFIYDRVNSTWLYSWTNG